MADKPRTVVLLSGGLNSAVMLYELVTFGKVEITECMIFDSDDAVDLGLAQALCDRLELQYSVWGYDGMPVIDFSSTDLYSEQPDLNHDALLSTMLIHSIHRAILLKAESVTIGLCHQDVDFNCMNFTDLFVGAAKMMSDYSLKLSTPMWEMDKAEIFDRARELNRLVEVTAHTNSCDIGNDDIQHQWGYGCGSCPGCVRRWKAWDEYLQLIGQGPTA